MAGQEDALQRTRLDKVADTSVKVSMEAATFVILALLALIIVNAVIRSFSGGVVPGAYEIGQVAMPVLVFLALPWTFLKKNNYQLDLFYARFSDRRKRLVDVVHTLLYIVTLAIWSHATMSEAIHSLMILDYIPGVIRVPVFPSRVVIGLGCLLMLLVLIRELVQRLQLLRLAWARTSESGMN